MNYQEINSVYCATLLYAWDSVKNILNAPLQIDNSLKDLLLLNNSKSHLNTLKTNEYFSTGNIEGDLIKVQAEFKKSLPFDIELESYNEDKLTFDKVKVASFGTSGYHREISKIIQIIYYKDDNNFIIKLLPKDKEHAIVLYKTQIRFKSMADIVADIDKKTAIGQREEKNQRSSWKYFLTDVDEVVIPKIEFNIETNYSTLEGINFIQKVRPIE